MELEQFYRKQERFETCFRDCATRCVGGWMGGEKGVKLISGIVKKIDKVKKSKHMFAKAQKSKLTLNKENKKTKHGSSDDRAGNSRSKVLGSIPAWMQ